MKVRRATPEDAGPASHVLAAVAEEGFLGAEPPVDVAEREQRFLTTIESQGPGAVWVLEERGRVVGYTALAEYVRGVLQLGMAILPEARGQGGGRAMLDAALEHARGSGAHKVSLEAWTDNGRAIALYAAAGFEVEGVRREHYRRRDGSLRSTLIMARRLV